MTESEIRTELEALRREGNSPRATLWDQRRILKRRRELHALLAAQQLLSRTGGGVLSSALAPLQPVIWVMPSTLEFLLMAGLGVTALAAQFLTAQAYRHAPAGTVAPFDYTALLYIGLISWLVFDEPPDLFTLIGAALLVVSGMIILREARRPKPASG